MYSERLLFGWSPAWWTAIATVINVAVVIFLAFVNFRYMRSAAKQAEAAANQASATVKQTSAAFENITLLKNQIKDQALLKLTETLIDLRRMNLHLESWIPKLTESWGQLPPFEGFLPDNWPSMVFVIERNMPSQKQNLRSMETHITNAEMLLNDQLARSASNRQPDVMKAVSNDLNAASRPLREILSELENQKMQ